MTTLHSHKMLVSY